MSSGQPELWEDEPLSDVPVTALPATRSGTAGTLPRRSAGNIAQRLARSAVGLYIVHRVHTFCKIIMCCTSNFEIARMVSEATAEPNPEKTTMQPACLWRRGRPNVRPTRHGNPAISAEGVVF